MRDFIKSVFSNIVADLLLAGMGLAAILLAWLKRLPTYQLLLIILFAVVIVFWSINQIDIFRERHKKGFSKQSDENIESALRKWLDKRQYSSQHKTDEKNLFCFVVTDQQKRPINIMRTKENPSVIRLLLALNEKELEDIPTKAQGVLRFRIGVEMARFGLLCQTIKPMYVHLDLPCDDLLTENIFLNAVDRIRQAHVLMVANVQVVRAQTETTTAKVQGTGNQGTQPPSA